jgi:hypothetical protein
MRESRSVHSRMICRQRWSSRSSDAVEASGRLRHQCLAVIEQAAIVGGAHLLR